MSWGVLTLQSKENLVGFQDIWWWLFIWVLFSSIFVHGVAALASFCSLHKHKQGRWYFASIAFMGLVMPLTGGIITCTVIAGVYDSLQWRMPPIAALLWGGGQTVLVIILSFLRLLPTL